MLSVTSIVRLIFPIASLREKTNLNQKAFYSKNNAIMQKPVQKPCTSGKAAFNLVPRVCLRTLEEMVVSRLLVKGNDDSGNVLFTFTFSVYFYYSIVHTVQK